METISLYLSLGSNLGDRTRNLDTALSLLCRELLPLEVELSDKIETQAWGFKSKNLFLNMAARLEIPRAGQNPNLYCHAVLDSCKRIERFLGRSDAEEFDSQGGRIYHSRIVDIDILFYGTECIDSDILTVPHKGIAERNFVLLPLRQLSLAGLPEAFPDIFLSK